MSELVSVIVPVYNHAQYLEQCLDSIYNDDYPNIELIIIDDGSKDNSLEVAKKWRESHPDRFQRFHLETQENLGICKTINKLVSLSKGVYICPSASDDYLLNGGISAKVAGLKEHPEWLAICGDAMLIDPSGNLISESAIDYFKFSRSDLIDPILFKMTLIYKWNIPFQIMFFRRETFSKTEGVGKYPEDMAFEDMGMAHDLLRINRYGFIDNLAYAYRYDPNKPVVGNLNEIDLYESWLLFAKNQILKKNIFFSHIFYKYIRVYFQYQLYILNNRSTNKSSNMFVRLANKFNLKFKLTVYRIILAVVFHSKILIRKFICWFTIPSSIQSNFTGVKQ